ncbi:hypothetical protein HELRODRAFT_171525 [Helobdella robusta]|uniref:Uncharacterized protein n=1 Tax=Helobdella robusta TaxID=6412 RepID=T1F4D5_HELRO|nr:hypothetical protein HELRODRAFT_171525 [Helobdella robusta]ESO05185.1 hypothetical protein HELRODRAFT_171525 [Helobdella robusta]
MDTLRNINALAQIMLRLEELKVENKNLRNKCNQMKELVELWQFHCLNLPENYCLECGQSKSKKIMNRLNSKSPIDHDEMARSAEVIFTESSSSASPVSATTPTTRLNDLSRKLKRFLSNKTDSYCKKKAEKPFRRFKSENSNDEFMKKAVVSPSFLLFSPFFKHANIKKFQNHKKSKEKTEKHPPLRKFSSFSVDLPQLKFPTFSRRASCDVVTESDAKPDIVGSLTLSAPSSHCKLKFNLKSDRENNPPNNLLRVDKTEINNKSSSFLHSSLSKSLIRPNVLLQFLPESNICSRYSSSNLSTLPEENILTFRNDVDDMESNGETISIRDLNSEEDDNQCDREEDKLSFNGRSDVNRVLPITTLTDAYSIRDIEKFNMALLKNISRGNERCLLTKTTESLQDPVVESLKSDVNNKSIKETTNKAVNESKIKNSTDKKMKTNNTSSLSLSLNASDKVNLDSEHWIKMNSLLGKLFLNRNMPHACDTVF